MFLRCLQPFFPTPCQGCCGCGGALKQIGEMNWFKTSIALWSCFPRGHVSQIHCTVPSRGAVVPAGRKSSRTVAVSTVAWFISWNCTPGVVHVLEAESQSSFHTQKGENLLSRKVQNHGITVLDSRFRSFTFLLEISPLYWFNSWEFESKIKSFF